MWLLDKFLKKIIKVGRLVITDYDGGLPSPDEQPINCDPEGDAGILPEGEQPCIVPTPKP